jgi:hypothetical protein
VGWQPLVLKWVRDVTAILGPDPAPITLFQVKEKFGGLRIYWQGIDRRTQEPDIQGTGSTDSPEILDPGQRAAILHLTEDVVESASRTCETCGAPGHLCKKGAFQTLCDSCAGQP